MYSSIATVCLSGSLEEKVDAIAEAGFEGLELFENDLTAFTGSPREAGELIRSRGLRLVTLQPFRDFEGLEGRARQQAFDRAEHKFDLMQELGTDLLMACSTTRADSLPGLSRAADDYRELGERAARRQLRVAFEALAWGRHIHDYRDSWEVVRRAAHPNVGLVLDTFHIFSRQTELGTIGRIPGDNIFLVQTADAPRLSMDHLSWSRHYRCFPGQGELQMDAFMEMLQETRYDGPLSHEIFNDVFRMGHSDQTARDGLRSYHLLRSMQNGSGIPAPQPVESVAFLEIAVEPGDLDPLRDELTAMGLACVGRHHTLNAERWAAGDVNLVLNTESNFTGRVPGRDATAITAIGLKVDNAYEAFKRADKLGYDIVEPEDVGSSHRMSALRNVDGSLSYIIDDSQLSRTWDREFTVDVKPIPQSALVDIDHISVALSYHDYLSLMLQYRAIFALEITPSFDVTDPRGLIQSQVLQNHNGRFRLALNASASPDTASNRFVRQYGGSGVHHVALRTRSIRETGTALSQANAPTLPIPGNYYRDLSARFDLSAQTLQWMQDHDVLFDQDSGGDFHQLYTRPAHKAFFFELVQREGYQGLGAPNAFIRVTAQQRLEAEIDAIAPRTPSDDTKETPA
ncbi:MULTISPECIES: bifunctional sugar phosphate isomerase/epimerase/4-hydroxyphenylpyruvate dioxygenase family protein [unclassified Halomonas]|uniref:bifunctional sugar phosphate isomerase/epimerase/4-hydroxyphenylpyruvate dioxygenase family protein n=1 Tax=unclassified Halomonas TaxID=2609666 RepID=UPI0021E3E5B5|nr:MULTISPECIES: sugar phosphate isomerase/epimerase and 4-hydroxyphenylpyruvate domain-containing protein [unclassified Halomonas]UYF99875.1 sugar phosphate isomerase/epimerase and 4-hydroxyphenylpyruvate domain-containing protein [Halomonas sp. GD1P12]WNL39037.1 TIM barrel protein [Halomonas sp. PAMB 3232]WNL42387.1 TIM barrel protein [Halomonas sp. PAMB 3264]